jgi:hypothetical protein
MFMIKKSCSMSSFNLISWEPQQGQQLLAVLG